MSYAYFFESNDSPLLISIPHMGLDVPPDLLAKMTPVVLELADTDWHLDQFYDFGRSLNANFLMARYSRYVVDLNRPPQRRNALPRPNQNRLISAADISRRKHLRHRQRIG